MEGEKDNSCIAEILQMREKGNQLYQAGKYNESIDVWFESLKSSLKSSVRFASSKLYENQFLCRLNLAMAYLKLENWIDAKEQSQLVLEQQPRNVKALLRLARAYEGLQDWKKCLEIIETIVQCVEDFKKNTDTQDTRQKSIIIDQDESLDTVHMFGLSPDYVLNYANLLKRRISKEEKMYWRRRTKMFQTIGSRLYDTETSSKTNEFVDESLNIHSKQEANKEQIFLSLISDQIILWTYQAEPSVNVHFSSCRLQLDFPLIRGLYFFEKEGVFKDDSTTLERNIDDPNNSLWTRIYRKGDEIDSCICAVSLPFSILYIVCLIFGMNTHGIQDGQRPMFSLDDWLGYDPVSLLKKSLIDAIIHRHQLTFFIIGAKCFEEVNCHWTSILRRSKMLTILNIVFIGFMDEDDTWEKCLGSKNLYTSSIKVTEQKAQQVNGFFYKTSFHNFVSSHSEVFMEKSHPLHPDFVCVIEQESEKKRETEDVSEIYKLDIHNIPVFIVCSGCIQENSQNDFCSNNMCESVKGQWIIPLQKNPYSIKKNVDDGSFSSSSMESVQENKHTSKISILNAAVGCIINSSCS